MNHPDYNSPAEIKKFLEENGMSMQKKFGQNFLINADARNRIAGFFEPQENDIIWEVGPGLGCMSEIFLLNKAHLTVFEIDKGFSKFLKEFFCNFSEDGTFSLVQGDVLKTWENEYNKLSAEKRNAIKLFGNLPYNIAATFIAQTITKGIFFTRCLFTVQKEVALRMCAKPSSKDYSSFSVLCQLPYDVKLCPELGPGNFWPRPNVASQTVLLTKKAELPSYSQKNFVKAVHALFSSRRKTILNNIKPLLPAGFDAASFLESAGLDSKLRAENLSVYDFARLSTNLSSAKI